MLRLPHVSEICRRDPSARIFLHFFVRRFCPTGKKFFGFLHFAFMKQGVGEIVSGDRVIRAQQQSFPQNALRGDVISAI